MNTAAEIFPPGEFLKDELEARGWSQTELAEIIGRPTRLINEIIAGKRTITPRSEEHTSELQSLMRNSYAVFCLKKKKHKYTDVTTYKSIKYRTKMNQQQSLTNL